MCVPPSRTEQDPALTPTAAHLALGIMLQAQGHLAAAEANFRRALALDPGNSTAQAKLRGVQADQGRTTAASALPQPIMPGGPAGAYALFNSGQALLEQGRHREAADCFQRVLAIEPDMAAAHLNLGVALERQGRWRDAATSYQQAIARQPDWPLAHYNFGNMLRKQGRLAEAAASFRQAIALGQGWPHLARAHNDLGVALRRQGQLEEAVASYQQAFALHGAFAEAHTNLGAALQDLGRLDEAVVSHQRALALSPHLALAHTNLGAALQGLGRLEESIASHRRALALDPHLALAHTNLGVALQDLGRLEESIASHRRALALDPHLALAHFNLALSLLQQGDYVQGWSEYEWRRHCANLAASRATPAGPQPLWDGQPLEGRTIVLSTEQGFGDAIQFVRYTPLVAARGATVALLCPPALQRLFQSVEGVVGAFSHPARLPAFSVQAPLMSLPHLLGTTLTTIPAAVPYLRSDPALMARWRPQLPITPGLRVGLVWFGSSGYRRNRERSLTLAGLAPLGQVPGVVWVALQKGEAAAQAAGTTDLHLHNLGPHLADFADTAAVVSQLDLVISVDTAVAHLAGALGKPVWLLLQHVPDWRWLLNREDSPWYPTARLFRQPHPGGWDDVVKRVAGALQGLAAARAAGTVS